MILFLHVVLILTVFRVSSADKSAPGECKENCDIKYPSCKDLKKAGNYYSGIYTIYPEGTTPLEVYCDQHTDNGGWTVIQRRVSDAEDFYRNWTEYVNGFGSLTRNMWIGLENIRKLTKNRDQTLLIEMHHFDKSKYDGGAGMFYVNGPEDNYRLIVDGILEGNVLRGNNNTQFSTYDSDHDTWPEGNSAVLHHGGWWYTQDTETNLNGLYKQGSKDGTGIFWTSYRGLSSLSHVEMKIRKR